MMIYTMALYTCQSALQHRLHTSVWKQYPQRHSGPDHFCIDFLKDDSPFDIFKLLDRLFHILLP